MTKKYLLTYLLTKRQITSIHHRENRQRRLGQTQEESNDSVILLSERSIPLYRWTGLHE